MNLLVEHGMPAICWLIIVILISQNDVLLCYLKIGNKNSFIMCATTKQDKTEVANIRKSEVLCRPL